jgi:glucose/arabinose dehydrogenase
MSSTRRLSCSRAAVLSGALVLALAGCGTDDEPTPAAGPDAPTTAPAPATGDPAEPDAGDREIDTASPQVIVTGLQVPWGVTFLPDGDALVSERDTGRLLRVPADGGAPTEVTRF